MFKTKHLVLAAAVAFIAMSAMASNFRAADQVYLPAAGHVATGSGTFISDVWIQNMTSDPVTVSVIYTATFNGTVQTPQYANDLITLAARERKDLPDFISAARPNGLGVASFFGTLIFNACRQGADCINSQDPTTGISPNFRDIAVFSRIYSIPLGGNAVSSPTTGQAFPGIPWYNYVSSRASNAPGNINLGSVVITGIRNTGTNQAGTYRSAIGFMNASQFSTTDIVVSIFAGNNPNTAIATKTFTLGPLNHIQQNVGAMFPEFGTGAASTNAFVRVSQQNSSPTSDAPSGCQPDGCPGFIAYGSLLDNLSNDPTTLEGIYESALSGSAQEAIYGSSAGKPNLRRAARRNAP